MQNAETTISLLSLNHPATFMLEVNVPVPGGKKAPVVFEMKYRTSSEYDEWIKGANSLTNRELFDSIVVGWKLQDAFNPENVGRLLDTYPKAAHEVGMAYVGEYVRVRAG